MYGIQLSPIRHHLQFVINLSLDVPCSGSACEGSSWAPGVWAGSNAGSTWQQGPSKAFTNGQSGGHCLGRVRFLNPDNGREQTDPAKIPAAVKPYWGMDCFSVGQTLDLVLLAR